MSVSHVYGIKPVCAVHLECVLPNNVFVYTNISIPVDVIHNASREEGEEDHVYRHNVYSFSVL